EGRAGPGADPAPTTGDTRRRARHQALVPEDLRVQAAALLERPAGDRSTWPTSCRTIPVWMSRTVGGSGGPRCRAARCQARDGDEAVSARVEERADTLAGERSWAPPRSRR